MLFSCKISNAVLIFLEREGEDLSQLLECTSLPEEFLRDPSYWMEATEMEQFLAQAQIMATKTENTQNSVQNHHNHFLQRVAHCGPELRAWGVLDSVLRMMPRPQEILAQPERFLSYFISPTPPSDNLSRTESSIEFDLAVSADQYPLATSYLAASFESLPTYVGQDAAESSWQGIHLKISWSHDQKTFFGENEGGRQISPELIRNILTTLEKHSRDLEEKNHQLLAKNEALLRSQKQLEDTLKTRLMLYESTDAPPIKNMFSDFKFDRADELDQGIAKLSDYMVRAQQLITILIAQGRMNPQVKEAMRRVDWDLIQVQFPKTVNDCRQLIQQKGELHV